MLDESQMGDTRPSRFLPFNVKVNGSDSPARLSLFLNAQAVGCATLGIG